LHQSTDKLRQSSYHQYETPPYREIVKNEIVKALVKATKLDPTKTPHPDSWIMTCVMFENWDMPLTADLFFELVFELQHEGVLHFNEEESKIELVSNAIVERLTN
jgi:hypothetical protein